MFPSLLVVGVLTNNYSTFQLNVLNKITQGLTQLTIQDSTQLTKSIFYNTNFIVYSTHTISILRNSPICSYSTHQLYICSTQQQLMFFSTHQFYVLPNSLFLKWTMKCSTQIISFEYSLSCQCRWFTHLQSQQKYIIKLQMKPIQTTNSLNFQRSTTLSSCKVCWQRLKPL